MFSKQSRIIFILLCFQQIISNFQDKVKIGDGLIELEEEIEFEMIKKNYQFIFVDYYLPTCNIQI
jgi:hypothetical protein